jgi:2-oxoglutarate ferredoxin oxidoreductase subunit beta
MKVEVSRKPLDYAVNRPPIWCPGCGVLEALRRALAELGDA